MTVAFIAQCTPFPSLVHLHSIERIAWQDCPDLCIACASDYICLYCGTDCCFIDCSVDCFEIDCIVDCIRTACMVDCLCIDCIAHCSCLLLHTRWLSHRLPNSFLAGRTRQDYYWAIITDSVVHRCKKCYYTTKLVQRTNN